MIIYWILGFTILLLVVILIFWCIIREMRKEERIGDNFFTRDD